VLLLRCTSGCIPQGVP